MPTLGPALSTVLFALAALAPADALAQPGDPDATAEEARRLESYLVAPCCWTEPLDVHDSPLAHDLRDEISARLGRGEPALAIERDLVARYGERIRAVPSGIETVAGWGSASLALVGLALVVRRSRARSALPPPATTPSSSAAELDARLASELAALDDVDVV
jgi:cytochrome c-type biogenesis protein CcmH